VQALTAFNRTVEKNHRQGLVVAVRLISMAVLKMDVVKPVRTQSGSIFTNAPNVAAKAGVGTKYQPIKVSFKLHKKDFDSGFSASVLDLATVRVLTPETEEDLAYLKMLAKLYQDFTTHYLGRIADDVANEKSETANNDAATTGEDVDDEQEIPI